MTTAATYVREQLSRDLEAPREKNTIIEQARRGAAGVRAAERAAWP
jgi:hypothetical protein